MKTAAAACLLVAALLLPRLAPEATAQQPETPAVRKSDLNALDQAPAVKKAEEAAAGLLNLTKSISPGKAAVPAPLAPGEVRYDVTKSIKVSVNHEGEQVEQPFVPIPILFKVGTDELRDKTAADNVRLLAEKLRSIREKQAGATFVIEGHASAEGDDKENLVLSRQRARKIESLLVDGNDVPPAAVSGTGLGEEFAQHEEDGPEELRQQDRKVLVVRVR